MRLTQNTFLHKTVDEGLEEVTVNQYGRVWLHFECVNRRVSIIPAGLSHVVS